MMAAIGHIRNLANLCGSLLRLLDHMPLVVDVLDISAGQLSEKSVKHWSEFLL